MRSKTANARRSVAWHLTSAFLGRRAFSNTSSGVVPWLALIRFLLAAGDSDGGGDRPPEGAPP
jgi:hypothetical protein